MTETSIIQTLWEIFRDGGVVGLCFLLLCFIVWLIRRIFSMYDKNVQVIASNTTAIDNMATATEAVTADSRRLYEHILSQK